LSQKAVAAAYHNDGLLNTDAFVAQYGSLPERPKRSEWHYSREPILLDLFLYHDRIPTDMMPLLASLAPPPDKFQIEGLGEAPQTAPSFNEAQPLWRAETEEAGQHDLLVFLRLVDQGAIRLGASSRLQPTSVAKLAENLLVGDFLPLPQKIDLEDTYRPYGLNMFAIGAGLTLGGTRSQLTEKGKTYLNTQDPELLLDAFETWADESSFDELERIPAIRGRRSRNIRLTAPGARRARIVEALSWCPVGVWIPIEDFYRAIKIWHFDFDLEEGHDENLYMGYSKEVVYHGWAEPADRWLLTRGLYINAILWEYLGSIGALDLLYLHPEDADFPAEAYYHEDEVYYSRYDGLKYFRINRLGAYLFGQAGAYSPPPRERQALYTVTPALQIVVHDPVALTPNLRAQLAQLAVDEGDGRYRLDTQLLLTALADGHNAGDLAGLLAQGSGGPLPSEVVAWFDEVKNNSQAFSLAGEAFLLKADTAALVQMALADPTLGKFCKLLDARTLIVPANRATALRNRLKELGYGVK
jgi:hypothetical protein